MPAGLRRDWILLVWVNEELVPQVEMAPDPSVVVDEALLQVLLALGRRELAELSRVVADLHGEVLLSTDRSELRALREAADAADHEWRSIDGEVRLTVPTSTWSDDWLAVGLAAQMRAAPTRWRHDLVTAFSTLVMDLEDAARRRRRRRRLVLGGVAAGGAAAGAFLLRTRVASLRRRR